MTDDNRPGRSDAIEMAEATVKEFRNSFDTWELQLENILSTLALLVYDMTEADLRDYLTMGGINLRDKEMFKLASDYVSFFVAGEAVEISDLFSFSLVDVGGCMAQRLKDDPELQAKMDKVKSDGIFFRMMVAEEE
jgi:hypothetical protein